MNFDLGFNAQPIYKSQRSFTTRVGLFQENGKPSSPEEPIQKQQTATEEPVKETPAFSDAELSSTETFTQFESNSTTNASKAPNSDSPVQESKHQEQSNSQYTPEQIVEHTVFEQSFSNLVQSSKDISPELAAKLDKEFGALLKDFVADANLATAFPELNPVKAIKKASGSASSFSSSKAQYPNVRITHSSEPYSEQEIWLRKQHQAKVLGNLGSEITDVYRPHEDVLKPKGIASTTWETLLAAGVHLGHSVSMFRPSTQPYIYGVRDGIHIINLETTLAHLRRAAKVAEEISENGGIILYVGTRPGQQRSLELAAKRSKGYYVHKRWVPGTLTNCREVSQHWERTELDMGDNETGRLLSPNVKRSLIKPDLVVILNPVENRNAIYECIQSNVPTIGIVDTNSEPSLLSYPIPGNDDSIRATDLIVGVISKSAERGRQTRLKLFQEFKKQKQYAPLDDPSEEVIEGEAATLAKPSRGKSRYNNRTIDTASTDFYEKAISELSKNM